MDILLKIAEITNLSIDEVGERSRKWIEMMNSAYSRMRTSKIKMISLALRIPPDKFKELDNITKSQEDIPSEKNAFNDDIRLYEALGGTITKIPKQRKK